MPASRWAKTLVLSLFFALAPALHAQWVLAAHAAKNQINRMSQHSASGGYDRRP